MIVWRWDRRPFGDTAANEDPDGDGRAFTFNLRLPGQYFDGETGLHYNYFRHYDPSLGRYIQSDPIDILRDYSDPQMQVTISMGIPLMGELEVGGSTNPLGIFSINQMYGYANQNPLSFIDPFGLSPDNNGCLAKLKACRVNCARRLFQTSACWIKCEEKYGAMSKCKDKDECKSEDF
ncbi:MAG: RHS repeat domain-containing protein [Parahaliea sp.]